MSVHDETGKRTALLVIDMQVGLFTAATPRWDADGVVARINAVVKAVRHRGGTVVFIQHDGPAGDPFEPGQPGWALLPGLVRDAADMVVHKTACDAFYATDLARLLEARGVRQLIVTGCATDYCVDTTVRAALSRDFDVLVVADGHTTADRPHVSAESLIRHYNWLWPDLIHPTAHVRVMDAASVIGGPPRPDAVPAAASGEIRCTRSRIAYQNRWLRVREDEIVRADGSVGLYGVVEKPHFAVIIPVSAAGIHLVQQYRYPVGGRFWELPQGACETREVTPEALARAELREETGLVAGQMRHIGHLFLAYGFCSQDYDVFLATDLTQFETQQEPEEIGLVNGVFPVGEVERMVRDGTIQDATTVAAFGLARMKGIQDVLGAARPPATHPTDGC